MSHPRPVPVPGIRVGAGLIIFAVIIATAPFNYIRVRRMARRHRRQWERS